MDFDLSEDQRLVKENVDTRGGRGGGI